MLAVAAFPSLRPGVRAAIAFTFGAFAVVNGGRHAHHMLLDGATANDVTGALAMAAGVVLIGLAAWIPFRHRGEGAATPARRWTIRVLTVPACLLAIMFFYGPVGMGIVDIHSLHRSVGSPPSAAYETVGFTASDGVGLEGWYRPSENGASVLMISGGGGNRRSTLRHAKMLVRHGYGVLVYDPRGSGNSEGTVNSYGWGWEKDAAAALDFLAERADVEPGRDRDARALDRRRHRDRHRRAPRRRQGRGGRRRRGDRLRGHRGLHGQDARPARRCGCCSSRSR